MFCYSSITTQQQKAVVNKNQNIKNKIMSKAKTLHRHLHPVHWHGSMIVAIAALLITALKTSDELLKALPAPVAHTDSLGSVELRNAETVHSSFAIGGLVRHATVGGS